jgi:hypothetical protein
MAGNIQWYRWYHGTCSDPKFALVARRSGASLPDVLAVWAYLLERASASQDRGSYGEVDHEAVDCMFGFPSTETRTADVMAAMEDRKLIGEGRVTQWEKRQPKRERDDPDAAERKRAERERAAAEAAAGGGKPAPSALAAAGQDAPAHASGEPVTPPAASAGDGAAGHANGDGVTPCHATSRQKRPREEKRRKRNTNTPPTPPPLAGGAFAVWWAEWPEGPRKVDQVGCERHWRRHRLDDKAEAVLAGLRAAKASEAWRKAGGEFVPAPRTWLRQRRWEAPTEAQAQAALAEATWRDSRSGVEHKGEQLGLGRWDEKAFSLGRGEAFAAYEARVVAAAGLAAEGAGR